ncbi:hypothetical protein NMG60_11009492 [Bertholletia excelsa]
MATKTSYVAFLMIILWLSLFALLVHEFVHVPKSKIHRGGRASTPSLPSLHPQISRQVKFDFTPFLKHHRHNHHRKHPLKPAVGEIDPLYGHEKRLVPTGPNPLHH